MTKAGGIPAHPIVQPETSGHRPLGKGGQSREGAEGGFGFPEHLTNLEGDKPQSDGLATQGTGSAHNRTSARMMLAEMLVIDGGRAGDVETARTSKSKQGTIADFVAELKRMLADDASAATLEGEVETADVGDVQKAEANPFEVLQNVVALLPQGAIRNAASVAMRDAARTDGSDAKVLPLPIMTKHAAAPMGQAADVAPSDTDVTAAMPGAVSPDDAMEFPTSELRVGRPAGRTAEVQSDVDVGRDSANSEVKITAVRQETHFSPMTRSSPAVQIADAVANGLTDPETQNATRAIFDPAAAKPASTAPLRVLHIQLQPVELGTVNVSLSLKADVLELHLEAMRADTADLLRRDREVLSDLLRQSGYDIDAVSVRIADADSGLISGGQSPSHTSGQMPSVAPSGQTQSGWSMPDDRSRGTRQQPGEGQHPSQAQGETARGDSVDTGSGAVYI